MNKGIGGVLFLKFLVRKCIYLVHTSLFCLFVFQWFVERCKNWSRSSRCDSVGVEFLIYLTLSHLNLFPTLKQTQIMFYFSGLNYIFKKLNLNWQWKQFYNFCYSRNLRSMIFKLRWSNTGWNWRLF